MPSEQGWTKGPWEVDPRVSTRVRDEADTTIASAGRASRVLGEAQAIAKLLAAAPELYETLRDVLNIEGNLMAVNRPNLLKKIKAALAKADAQ